MNSRILLRKLINITQVPVRECSVRSTGIKYYGFTYYPRRDDFKDPPYEPSKLFFIRRIKPIKGTTAKERKWLGLLNIDGLVKDSAHVSVVKNIPEVNALLWKVKHLIEIKPITYKGELPKDFTGTHLRSTGELVISPKLRVSSEQIQISEKLQSDENQLRRTYLRDYLKKKWLNGFSGGV